MPSGTVSEGLFFLMHGVQPVAYPTRTRDRGERDICGIAPDGAESPTAVPAHSPPPDKFDWIQLTSDEWLKGEFIALYTTRWNSIVKSSRS